MSLGKQTSHRIVTHEVVASILAMQREDICIPTNFHCRHYQATTEAWVTTGESLKDINSQVWAMSLSQLSLLYGSLGAIKHRSTCASPEVPAWPYGLKTFPFRLERDPPALRPKSPGEFGGLGETISGTSEEAPLDISSTQREDVCILTKFHCWLYQATTEAWETTEKSLKYVDFASLGDEVVIIVVCMVHLWSDQVNCSYDNCDRLVAQTCGSIPCRLPSLVAWACKCSHQKYRLNFILVQISALCVGKIFATDLWLMVQREVCLPNNLNPAFHYHFIHQRMCKKG